MTNKKVLIFSYAYYPYVGGAEIAIKEITDRLGDISFDLITYNLGGESKEERIGNVDVYRIKAITKYLYPALSFFKGLSLHRENHYDVVWAMMSNTGFSALFLKLFFPKIKFVLSVQEGDPIPQIKRRVWFVYPFFKMIFRYADNVTTLSNYLADFARSMGARSAEVVPNGVDLDKFKVKSEKLKINEKIKINGELRINDGEKIILVTTGRLVKKNAVDDIIRSLKFLPDNVVFRSVGSGEDEISLKYLVLELGLENRVEFIPYADHDKVSELLRSSHIFVRPSLSEGLGNSFLEAMALGLPIIGTNVGGIPDFLKGGKTGLFCEVRNPKSIALKVMMLIEDKDLYQRISENGRRIVSESYDWEVIAKRFGAIFADDANSQ